MRDQRGRRRGFADDGHAGEERARRFFGEAPRGEVERVDVHGDAEARDPHVRAEEARAASELNGFAVVEDVMRRRASSPSSA